MSKTNNPSDAITYRQRHHGLISIRSKVQMRDSTALSLVYTPGVAEPCLEIARNPKRSFDVTCRGNTIAIVSDGSAAYGIGNVGPEAILPVLESKAVILKNFAGIDALPLALHTNNVEEFIDTVLNLAPTFGAINLEDTSSTEGLIITNRLERALNIPILNSHREGVAIGVLAGLINAMRLIDKDLKQARIVINGAGAAGLGTAFILHRYGVQNVIVCDRHGAIYKYRPQDMNWAKWEIAKMSNPHEEKGELSDIIKQADVLINFVGGITLTPDHIKSMTPQHPVLFTFGSPIAISPYKARTAGATIIATAHSTYPNQMDIAAVIPGVFRGLLDVRATTFCVPAQIAAAEAIAGIISQEELHPDNIYPRILDYNVAPTVAEAVARVTIERGYARQESSPEEVAERTRRFVYEGRLPVPPKSDQPMTIAEESLEMHDRFQGVLEIQNNIPVKDEYILKQFYLVPGAMEPTRLIQEDIARVFDLTARGNLVGIVSDGSAVLGLGNIGGRAALPVMEGKAILFHTFAGVEAFPICLNTQDPDEIIEIVKRLEPTFGGINLEDISAPRCFTIEERLKAETKIPIFHDDQHGTAVIVLAGLLNACRILGKEFKDLSLVVNGAGASAVAVTKLLMASGLEDVVMLDTTGILYKGRKQRMNWIKEEMAAVTNQEKLKGNLAAAVKGRNVFLGLSAPNVLTQEMIKSMAPDPIIFALANPTPEIMPDDALAAGAAIVATGRSDLPNQVNNSLAFPGIFRGALDTRVINITDEMKIAAAHAIANLVSDKALRPDWIIPKGTDFSVAPAVAQAVAQTAIDTGMAQVKVDPAAIAAKVLQHVYEKHR